MERGASLVSLITGLLRDGSPVGILAESGLGTTTALRSVASAWQGPTEMSGALRALSTTPYLPLSRALHSDVAARSEELDQLVGAHLGREGLLVLDDLQWGDPQTLAVLGEIADATHLVVGIRRGDPGEESARRAISAHRGVIVPLAPMEPSECAAIVRRSRPGVTEGDISILVRGCAGNPGVLEQLLESGQITADLKEALARAIVGRSAGELAALALLSRSVDGLDAAELGTDVSDLVSAGLVTQTAGIVRLRHEATGDAAYDALMSGERARVHLRLADLAGEPRAVAEHLLLGGAPSDALETVLAAIEQSSGRQRVELLDLAARCATGPERAEYLAAAAELALEVGDVVLARGCAEAMLEALDHPSSDLLALVAECRARDRDAPATLAAAADVVAGAAPATRARALGARALVTAWPLWQPQGALDLAQECAELTDREQGTAFGVLAAGVAQLVAGVAGVDLHHLGPMGRTLGLLVQGDGERAQESVASATTTDRDLLQLVVSLHRHGDCDGAAARLAALAESIERPSDREVLFAHLALALADSGRTAAASALATERLAEGPTPAGEALLRWALVEAELSAGRLTRARSASGDVADRPDSPAARLAAVAAAWAGATAPGGPVPTEAPGPSPWTGLEAADLELAALADSIAGAPPDVVDAGFSAAADGWDGWHRRGALRCRWAAADAALAGPDRGDALDRLREVEALALPLGLRPLVARVRASLRAGGVRTRPRRGTGRGPLSAREVEVMELVRLGFTSREAGQALGVAPSTVDTQVESAVRKLGARNRLHAAALLAEVES